MKDYDLEQLEYYLAEQNAFWQKTIIHVINWLENYGFEIRIRN